MAIKFQSTVQIHGKILMPNNFAKNVTVLDMLHTLRMKDIMHMHMLCISFLRNEEKRVKIIKIKTGDGKVCTKRRMVSSGLLRRVALVRTDVSEEPGASFMRVTKIGELGTTQVATSNRRTLRRNTIPILGISSQLTSVASCSLCCS
jgi:hypothetical protein